MNAYQLAKKSGLFPTVAEIEEAAKAYSSESCRQTGYELGRLQACYERACEYLEELSDQLEAEQDKALLEDLA